MCKAQDLAHNKSSVSDRTTVLIITDKNDFYMCSNETRFGESCEMKMRFDFLTLVRMAIIKKSTNNFWSGCGEKETHLHY